MRITRHPALAKYQREQTRKESTCPFCETLNLPTVCTKYYFFKLKQIKKYTCVECGAQWEVDVIPKNE